MKVGLNIRAVRKRKGLTLDELGELCGIGRDELGGYERGEMTPRPETVKRIAAVLEVPIISIRDGMGWTEPQTAEDWESSKGDNLLRDGIIESMKESYRPARSGASKDVSGLNGDDILALMEMVKASIPAFVEYMKDTRPEHEINCEILKELDIVQEDSEEELIRRYALTDEQWEQICGLLPSETAGNGRPFKSNRLMLDAILFRMKSGVSWNRLPKHFGRHKCVIERLQLWRKMGIWQSVLDKIYDLAIIDEDFIVELEK